MNFLKIIVILSIITFAGTELTYGQQNEAMPVNDILDDSGGATYDIDKLEYISLFNFIVPFALLFTSIVILIKNYKNFNLLLAVFSLTCTSASLAIHEFAIVYLDKTAHEITMTSTTILFIITVLFFGKCISTEIYRLSLLNVVGFFMLFMLLVTIAFVTQYSIMQVASFTALGFVFAIILIVIVVNTFVE